MLPLLFQSLCPLNSDSIRATAREPKSTPAQIRTPPYSRLDGFSMVRSFVFLPLQCHAIPCHLPTYLPTFLPNRFHSPAFALSSRPFNPREIDILIYCSRLASCFNPPGDKRQRQLYTQHINVLRFTSSFIEHEEPLSCDQKTLPLIRRA